MRGTLTRFNEHNGIGAITSEQGIEVLVHKNSMEPSRWPLKQGQSVAALTFGQKVGDLGAQ